MKYDEIRKLFADNCEECYRYDEEPRSLIEGMYRTDNLLEIEVEFNDAKNIKIFYGNREEHIDITNTGEDDYIVLGSVMISPMKDIDAIYVKWRRGL